MKHIISYIMCVVNNELKIYYILNTYIYIHSESEYTEYTCFCLFLYSFNAPRLAPCAVAFQVLCSACDSWDWDRTGPPTGTSTCRNPGMVKS